MYFFTSPFPMFTLINITTIITKHTTCASWLFLEAPISPTPLNFKRPSRSAAEVEGLQTKNNMWGRALDFWCKSWGDKIFWPIKVVLIASPWKHLGQYFFYLIVPSELSISKIQILKFNIEHDQCCLFGRILKYNLKIYAYLEEKYLNVYGSVWMHLYYHLYLCE